MIRFLFMSNEMPADSKSIKLQHELKVKTPEFAEKNSMSFFLFTKDFSKDLFILSSTSEKCVSSEQDFYVFMSGYCFSFIKTLL